LNPFPPVELGGTRFLIDQNRPVAFLQSGETNQFVTWPNAPLPRRTATARLVTVPNAVWVVYEEDAPDSGELAWSTAVRISADGIATGVDIGQLSVLGVDSAGIWASNRSWPAPEPLPGDEEFEEAPSFDGAGLPLESWHDFQRQEKLWHQGREGTFPDVLAVGATDSFGNDDDAASYGWFAFAPGESPEGSGTRFAAPSAPGPSAPAELVRFTSDGRVDTLSFDRTVAGIEQVDTRTVITFFPTNPVGTLDEISGAISYSYPRSQIVVDFTTGIPSALSVDDYQPTALPAAGWAENWEDAELDEVLESDAHDHVDLTGVDGIEWALAKLSPEEIRRAVARVVEQFEWLAKPNAIWTRRDDQVHLVESPCQDVRVRVSGDWPRTVVMVEFRHREYSDALYRRRYNVFDPTGRPIDAEYLVVYLEEDIATGDHPAEHGGVIEWPFTQN
jgi:hypothetical protein